MRPRPECNLVFGTVVWIWADARGGIGVELRVLWASREGSVVSRVASGPPSTHSVLADLCTNPLSPCPQLLEQALASWKLSKAANQ